MSAITRHLVRQLNRSVPLPTLKQGGTLSLRSAIPNVAVRIQPEWRDDGQATFSQSSPSLSEGVEAAMKVAQEGDKMTSLGRSESHVSIHLERASEATTVESILSKSGATLEESNASLSEPIAFPDGDDHVEAWLVSADEKENANSETEQQQQQQKHEGDSVTLTVPEKVNIVCELEQGGSIQVAGKIEGDVRLMTTNGDIRVKKLRGHTVDLETRNPSSSIYASDLLEAFHLKLNLLQGGRLRAKRIHGETVDIRVSAPPHDNHNIPKSVSPNDPFDEDDEGSLVDISSLYVSGAGGAQVSLDAGLRPEKRAVRIKSHHGPVMVDVDGVYKPTLKNTTPTKDSSASDSDEDFQFYPLVELGSVNGSCELNVRNIPSENDNNITNEDWIACQIHYDSVSPESVSLIHTESGNVALTFDRKLEADLRLLSSRNGKSLEDTAGILADEDDLDTVKSALSQLVEETPESSPSTDASRIYIETQSYTESERFISPNHVVEYVEGWVENKSHEPDSRFEMKTRGGAEIRSAAGKIRQEGAAEQALERFSSPGKSGNSDVKAARPLIVAATTGSISVESLSWLGAIARRYGLDETGKTLGRQATRRGRSVLPADE
jgi:hypothetical protein